MPQILFSCLNVSGQGRFSSFIRRSFSPKHEAKSELDRPLRTVFSSSSAPRSETIGNHRRRSFYILVYNSFWLASVAPRRTICDEVSEIPAVVDSESHGSNMGFVGESGVCSFSGNRVRHGTNRITRYMDFTKRRKSLQLVLITTFGLSRNIYSNIVSKTLVLDDLLR